jgi:hypothetical protein
LDELRLRLDPDDRRDLDELRDRDALREREPLDDLVRPPDARRFRVAAAFRAEAERAALDRRAEAAPPFLPPFREDVRVLFFPRPEPLFFPPLSSLFTVAQARRSASLRDTPRSS